MVVSVENEDGLVVGRPEVLVEDANLVRRGSYDISPDGQRFLMIRDIEGSVQEQINEQTSLVVVENWFEELKRLAPPDAP